MGVWEYGSMGVWEFGSMGVWEYGSMGVWEYGSMGVWEYGSMGVWEYGSIEWNCNINYFFGSIQYTTPFLFGSEKHFRLHYLQEWRIRINAPSTYKRIR